MKAEEKNERFTLFTKASMIKKLDYIALQRSAKENMKISRTDLVNETLEEFITKWEKKNGDINIK